jgi:hypothetical protein
MRADTTVFCIVCAVTGPSEYCLNLSSSQRHDVITISQTDDDDDMASHVAARNNRAAAAAAASAAAAAAASVTCATAIGPG